MLQKIDCQQEHINKGKKIKGKYKVDLTSFLTNQFNVYLI